MDGTVIVFTPSAQQAAEQTAAVNPQVTRPPSIQPTKPVDQPIVASTAQHDGHHHNPHQHQPGRFNEQPAVQPTQTYPTGLVTVLSNTMVHNGLVTEMQTKVFGTYINGKYAQILKSSSRINEPMAFSSPVYVNPTRSFQEQVKPTNVNQDFKQFINSRMDHLKPKRGENVAEQPTTASSDKEDLDKNSMSNIIKRNRANRFGTGGRFQYQPRAQPKVRDLLDVEISETPNLRDSLVASWWFLV